MSIKIVLLNKLTLSLLALSVSTSTLAHTAYNHAIGHDDKNSHSKVITPVVNSQQTEPNKQKSWLAGDHHIHSQYSVGWDKREKPPKAIVGGDAIYPIYKNAQMASKFGLSWMVATDHGGPNHSKINREQAYPELLESRKMVADVLQFYGLELNTPAGDHSSIIVPHTHDEAQVLLNLESAFDTKEAFPNDPARHTEQKMIEALKTMQALDSIN